MCHTKLHRAFSKGFADVAVLQLHTFPGRSPIRAYVDNNTHCRIAELACAIIICSVDACVNTIQRLTANDSAMM